MAGFLSKAELEALVTGSVQTADIANGAVTLPKLPDGVLTADAAGRAKVADGFINNAKVAADAAIAKSKLGTGVVKATIIAGGVAGDHTVTGIALGDALVAVLHVDFTDASETGDDITSEFTITAADTINNAGGTNTTGGFLVVIYEDRT